MAVCFEKILEKDSIKRFVYGDSIDCYKLFGSKLSVKKKRSGEVSGVSFSVWAPSARNVRIVGDFNGWGHTDPSCLEKRKNLEGNMKRNPDGIWIGFIEGLGEGTK